ncbi:MAG: toll/interleukin-1 receptor domain-containing protein [Acidobacteriota bacterium]|nr:toll/interleukin-1 receptor domain-containing protein [Acidobacteriota bacterium]
MGRTKVFISYSHKDAKWKNLFVKYLDVLRRQKLLKVWEDSQIGAGDDWYKRINDAMLESCVAVLLVSVDFLTSDFILKKEVPFLLKCHAEDGMRIVPVLLRPCPWEEVGWLRKMQIRPGEALSKGSENEIEENLVKITYEILDIVRQSKKSKTSKRNSSVKSSKRQTP